MKRRTVDFAIAFVSALAVRFFGAVWWVVLIVALVFVTLAETFRVLAEGDET